MNKKTTITALALILALATTGVARAAQVNHNSSEHSCSWMYGLKHDCRQPDSQSPSSPPSPPSPEMPSPESGPEPTPTPESSLEPEEAPKTPLAPDVQPVDQTPATPAPALSQQATPQASPETVRDNVPVESTTAWGK